MIIVLENRWFKILWDPLTLNHLIGFFFNSENQGNFQNGKFRKKEKRRIKTIFKMRKKVKKKKKNQGNSQKPKSTIFTKKWEFLNIVPNLFFFINFLHRKQVRKLLMEEQNPITRSPFSYHYTKTNSNLWFHMWMIL
jgi:hypothetical protein